MDFRFNRLGYFRTWQMRLVHFWELWERQTS